MTEAFVLYKALWRDICAMLPVYSAEGANGCEIYYTDGTVRYMDRRLTWVLDDLLGYLCTDKQLLQQQSARWLERPRAKRLPLAVMEDFTLVPVKGRDCPNKYDGVSGYAVLEYVQSVRETERGTVIRLGRKQRITVLDSGKTVRRNLRIAQRVAVRYRQEYEN